ncbi:MAG: nucleotide exchange factor GrpE [Oscillospiraceae bacterium]
MSEKKDEKDIQNPQVEQQSVKDETVLEDTACDINAEKEKLEKEVADLNDKLLRKIAEFDNFRKRTQKEKEAIYPQAKADTVEKFIPIIDTFERALVCECADAEFKKGVDMIYASFTDVMNQCNVEPIGKEGDIFDPNLHNAVMHEEDPEKGDGIVTQVLQKGYKIGDKIIRYAMVKVVN